jgi:hypothetical protein
VKEELDASDGASELDDAGGGGGVSDEDGDGDGGVLSDEDGGFFESSAIV